MKKINVPHLPLSERQWEFLHFLNGFIEDEGRPPTYREIAVSLGISSKGTVSTMVERLKAKGVLDIGLTPLLETGHAGI